MKILILTSEWPTPEIPIGGLYIYWQVESLRKAGVEVDVFSFRGRKNIFHYLSAWLRLRRTYRIQNYDLVHAHFGQSGLLALPKVRPLVTTFHGDDLLGIQDEQGKMSLAGRVLPLASRLVAACSDGNIVVSKELLDVLNGGSRRGERKGDRPVAPAMPAQGRRPITILPCGINLERFTPLPMEAARAELGLPAGKKLVFFAANPGTEVKRFHLAWAAVQKVQEKMAGVELVVANNIPYEKMPLYMNACDVLLLTSIHEGSPQVVKEALACNLPVVSVDVGDVTDRIAGKAGFRVCADHSPETIAGDLLEILQQNQRSPGREAVLELDEKIITEKLIRVYRQVLDHAK